MNIVLIEPEIPNNTGNIGRLCLAAGAKLHLVKPFGFEISDSRLKRAGLDYWQHLEVFEYDSVDDFFEQHRDKQMAFFSSHGAKSYWDVPFVKDIFLVFGKESKGLSKEIISAHSKEIYKIPLQSDKVRSLNLANAVAIVAYEGLRQLNS
ncbi:MAG: tRNA (cytidine/uridine-2'-O-)-methyltransferase [Chitinophagales bacterium]